MVNALKKEIELRHEYLPDRKISTIYFGGGTPSVLSTPELNSIFEVIRESFEVDPNAEITLEANPDDIEAESLLAYQRLGINRLSLGVQSFDERHLKFLNRAHNAHQAKEAIALIKSAGFTNYTIDLIYAIPASTHQILERDLEMAMKFDVPHLSCYNLTIEPNTAFGRWVAKGQMTEVDEDFAIKQYHLLTETLEGHNFIQYEISNFCKEGFKSKHNSNYWDSVPYLGIGPGAHSFDGSSRQANISNNALYIKSLLGHKVPATVEHLDHKTLVNERIMTSIRKIEGIDLNNLIATLHFDLLDYQNKKIKKMIADGLLSIDQQHLKATKRGKLLADWIAGELFLV